MTLSLEQTTATQLATARKELAESAALAELAVLGALEAQAKAAGLQTRVARVERALAILRGEEPAVISPLVAHKPDLNPVKVPYMATSVAEQAAAARAAGDPLANRRVDNSDTPPPKAANRAKEGPQCPGCGAYGTIQAIVKMIGDKGPFSGYSCSDCGTEKLHI